MRRLNKQTERPLHIGARNGPSSHNEASKAIAEAAGKMDSSYVRMFFQRRLQLEMKVREKIFREGRCRSRLEQATKHRQMQRPAERHEDKISQKKRQLNENMGTWKKIGNYNGEILNHRKQVSEKVGEMFNQRIKQEGTTKTTKQAYKWQRDSPAIENSDTLRPQRNQVHPRFIQNQKLTNKKLRDHLISDQKLRQLSSSGVRLSSSSYYQKVQEQQLCTSIQVQNFVERPFFLEKHRDKRTGQVKANRFQQKQVKNSVLPALRPRSKGFKTEIGSELRDRLAKLIIRQKEGEKMRIEEIAKNNVDAHVQKRNLSFSEIENKWKGNEKEDFDCQQKTRQHIENEEGGQKKETNPSEELEKIGEQHSQILCAICQTNIPHHLWNHAVFYSKNRVEYYKFYQLFEQEQERLGDDVKMEEENDTIIPLLLHCGHSFHQVCLEEWFRYKAVCPLCKTGHNEEADQSESSMFEDAQIWNEEDSYQYQQEEQDFYSNRQHSTDELSQLRAITFHDELFFPSYNHSRHEPESPQQFQQTLRVLSSASQPIQPQQSITFEQCSSEQIQGVEENAWDHDSQALEENENESGIIGSSSSQSFSYEQEGELSWSP